MHPFLNEKKTVSAEEVSPTCPVCWEKIESEKIATLGCSHYICIKCCEKLINPTCPLCRQPIPSKTECLLPPMSPIQQREWTRRHPRRRRRRRGPRLGSMDRGTAHGEDGRRPVLSETREATSYARGRGRGRADGVRRAEPEAHSRPGAEKVTWSDKKSQKKKTKRHNNYFNNYRR